MPFDDLEENQNDTQTPPRRFGYPFVGDEDDAVNPAIALQPDVASTFMPQRSSAEPQVSSKPGCDGKSGDAYEWGFRKDDLEKRVVRRYVP